MQSFNGITSLDDLIKYSSVEFSGMDDDFLADHQEIKQEAEYLINHYTELSRKLDKLRSNEETMFSPEYSQLMKQQGVIFDALLEFKDMINRLG